MRMVRIIVVATAIAFLVESVSVPQQAEALSSGEIAAIVVGSVVGWFTFVIVGATLVYRKGSPPEQDETEEFVAGGRTRSGMPPHRRVRFGPECPAQGGPLPGIRPTACW